MAVKHFSISDHYEQDMSDKRLDTLTSPTDKSTYQGYPTYLQQPAVIYSQKDEQP